MENSELIQIIKDSPSIKLLKSRNAEFILLFMANVFAEQTAVSSDRIHILLENRLDALEESIEEDDYQERIETNEDKAKRWIKEWADRGFLTNYQNESGEVMYELSSYSSKVLDWIESLKKVDYIGTESKFKTLFAQLKELVEFTNEDRVKRIEILKERKLEIEQQIQKLEMGEDVTVFEEYQIVPRYNSLNKLAKELLSDFKEVDDNFKEIIRQIYHRQTDNLQKRDLLNYIFDAYGELKNSPQGKSFYSFWEFLLSSDLQHEWDELTLSLYQTLEEKHISPNDYFLKDLKQHLFYAGEKVTKTNDRMSEKLSKIIRQNEFSDFEETKKIINEIKRLLIENILKEKVVDTTLEIEEKVEINLPLERQLTYSPTREYDYKDKPNNARVGIEDLSRLEKIYNPYAINRKVIRQRINDILVQKSQTTLAYVIEQSGGIAKGLSEVFGYLGVLNEYHHIMNKDRYDSIIFDKYNGKSIDIPEIIITR